jgi:hypothetical protein
VTPPSSMPFQGTCNRRLKIIVQNFNRDEPEPERNVENGF